jgi:hypothetical protein
MKRTILAICFATLSACASTGDSSLRSRFTRERATLSCFEGPTSEPSCSGTGLAVFLSGEQVRHLDWTIEMSTRFIRRQYYFDGTSPRLVVETIHAKFAAQAELLAKPRLLSTEHYRLDAPQPNAHQKELLDHAKFLMDDFKKHRKEFTRVNNRNT